MIEYIFNEINFLISPSCRIVVGVDIAELCELSERKSHSEITRFRNSSQKMRIDPPSPPVNRKIIIGNIPRRGKCSLSASQKRVYAMIGQANY